MKPRITRKEMEFIECAECGFEQSCIVPTEIIYGEFTWFCPECGQAWVGKIGKGVGLVSVEKENKVQRQRYILIKLPVEMRPLHLEATRKETSEEVANRGNPGGKPHNRLETLLLLEDAADSENNPRGFPQYFTVIT